MTHKTRLGEASKNEWQLAQINIGCLKYDRDDDRVAGWRDNVERINALAETAPGFVWRLSGAEGQDTGQRMFANPRVVTNMSVWRSLRAFKSFVYKSEHVNFVRGRSKWFSPLKAHLALWWIEPDMYPNLDDGREKLELLSRIGPSAAAFTLRSVFEPVSTAFENQVDEAPRAE